MSVESSDLTYDCPLCPLSFATGKLRQSHKKAQHPRCDECLDRFPGSDDLEDHQKSSGHCFCTECKLHFTRMAVWLAHVRVAPHGTEYQCFDCGREYPNQAYLDRHCCDCDRVFRSPRGLDMHFASNPAHSSPLANVPRINVPPIDVPPIDAMSVDSSNLKYDCPLCPLSLATGKQRRRHTRAQHPRCDECRNRFPSSDDLEDHQKSSGHCFCTECNLHFARMDVWLAHLRLASHGTEYQCFDCGGEYPNESYLDRHCCDCDRVFRSRRGLDRHFASNGAHSSPLANVPRINVPPIDVPLIDAMSADSSDLKYRCPLCPTKCNECNDRFLSSDVLEAHQRASGHCFCGECHHHFARKAEYLDHVRVVWHETEYQCCDCGRKYTTQAQLDLHCCDCDKILRSGQGLEAHFANCPSHNHPAPKAEKSGAKEKKKGKKKRKKKGKKKGKKAEKARNICCPVGGKCSKKFATPSAALGHLESGRCRSGMTRDKLNAFVLMHDRNRYITNPDAAAALLQASLPLPLPLPDNSPALPPHPAGSATTSLPHRVASPPLLNDDNVSEWSVIAGVRLTPTSSQADDGDWSDINGVVLTPTHSEWSFISGTHAPAEPTPPSPTTPRHNLSCPLCARIFHNLKGLQMHLSSTAHSPKIFHCPFTFADVSGGGVEGPLTKKRKKQALEKKFSTLSGLAQHMEGGACKGGVVAFRTAIGFVEQELRGLGLGGVKLLMD